MGIFQFINKRKLKKELILIEPIYEIMKREEKWFITADERYAKKQSDGIDDKELIEELMTYMDRQLQDLGNYLASVQQDSRLQFFSETYNVTMSCRSEMQLHNLTDSFPNLLYFYNELKLGSNRVLTISEHLATSQDTGL
jgi:hypothetical protein